MNGLVSGVDIDKRDNQAGNINIIGYEKLIS